MRLLHFSLLLALLAACASDGDGTPTPAPTRSDTELDSVTDSTEGEPARFDPATQAGKTYLIEINGDTATDKCASPPTNPLICSRWPGLMGDAAFRIALQFDITLDGNLTVYAGSLDDRLLSNGEVRAMSSVDIAGNRAWMLFEEVEMPISDLPLVALKLTMEAMSLHGLVDT